MENQGHSIIDEVSDPRIYFTLRKFAEKDQQNVKDVFDGKEVVVEHEIRYGKIVCRFIPTPAREAVKDEFYGRTNPEAAIYRCGTATRDAHEKQVIKKLKAGTNSKELIDDFIKRQEIEGTKFHAPVYDLAQPYHFSQELMKLLPGFLQQIVEKLDISYICLQLDEYQTLDFVPRPIAETAKALKKTLVEDFLAKHSNEPALRQALRIKQGGLRRRKGFVWTNESKISFYEKVNSLPKLNHKSVWQFILDTLIEKEFDASTVSWLKTHPALSEIPGSIFDDALKTWRKYLFDMRWNELKTSEKPRAFEFRHALHLLGYPGEYTYSTLRTHYLRAKALVENQE